MICTDATCGAGDRRQRLGARSRPRRRRRAIRPRSTISSSASKTASSRRPRSAGSAAAPGRACRRRGCARERSFQARKLLAGVVLRRAARPGGPSWSRRKPASAPRSRSAATDELLAAAVAVDVGGVEEGDARRRRPRRGRRARRPRSTSPQSAPSCQVPSPTIPTFRPVGPNVRCSIESTLRACNAAPAVSHRAGVSRSGT